jgi:hypothetical protein
MMRVHELKRVRPNSDGFMPGEWWDPRPNAVGSEDRTVSLNEFTGFRLDMVEISREETTPHLNFLKEPFAKKQQAPPQMRPRTSTRLGAQPDGVK